jgi:hypothetical protein
MPTISLQITALTGSSRDLATLALPHARWKKLPELG